MPVSSIFVQVSTPGGGATGPRAGTKIRSGSVRAMQAEHAGPGGDRCAHQHGYRPEVDHCSAAAGREVVQRASDLKELIGVRTYGDEHIGIALNRHGRTIDRHGAECRGEVGKRGRCRGRCSLVDGLTEHLPIANSHDGLRLALGGRRADAFRGPRWTGGPSCPHGSSGPRRPSSSRDSSRPRRPSGPRGPSRSGGTGFPCLPCRSSWAGLPPPSSGSSGSAQGFYRDCWN